MAGDQHSDLPGEPAVSPGGAADAFYRCPENTARHERNLPHWQQDGVWVFVTWRLADALPASLLRRWHQERENWLRAHPAPRDAATEAEYHRLFSRQVEAWLDEGRGSCLLRDPGNATIVGNALRHFDAKRYALGPFVVMPNHVHVLFRLLQGHRLESVLKSWKGYTAREINRLAGRSGALWQEEYWDRLVRSGPHWQRCARYIRDNPSRARLPEGAYLLGGV